MRTIKTQIVPSLDVLTGEMRNSDCSKQTYQSTRWKLLIRFPSDSFKAKIQPSTEEKD